MSNNWTIKSEHLSKKFGITIKDVMRYGLRDSFRRLIGLSDNTDRLRQGEFWALKDASFELNRGDSLGVMGINGSGKTTLLRILHGIYSPDAGQVAMKGRVGALIAAGAGFAPMLTGRENVHINGALLGMTPKEIERRMGDIIDFSELGAFIDMPAKHYSSGMYVRLGFSIAVMSAPEILLIDEVLAVGDMNFQKKCYDYLLELKRRGTTIILVSHSVGAIWAICDRGIFLHEGEIRVSGSPEEVIRAYDEENARSALVSGRYGRKYEARAQKTDSDDHQESGSLPAEYGHRKGGTSDAIATSVRMYGRDVGVQKEEFDFGEPLLIETDIEVFNRIEHPLFRYTVDAIHYRFILTLDSFEQDLKLDSIDPGRYLIRVRIPWQNFRPGTYVINFSICSKNIGLHLFYWNGVKRFLIKHPENQFLYSDPNAIMHLDGAFSIESIKESP